MSSTRQSGSNAEPFRAYIDRTRGVAEVISSATFELRKFNGSTVFSRAAAVPADGLVELYPTVPEVDISAGLYQYSFECTLPSGKTYITPWLSHEIT